MDETEGLRADAVPRGSQATRRTLATEASSILGKDTAMGTSDEPKRHIKYKQYAITATSYSKAGAWIPRAEVDDSRGAAVGVQSVTWKGAHTFPTRDLADQRAFAMGKRWVDERG